MAYLWREVPQLESSRRFLLAVLTSVESVSFLARPALVDITQGGSTTTPEKGHQDHACHEPPGMGPVGHPAAFGVNPQLCDPAEKLQDEPESQDEHCRDLYGEEEKES